MELERARVDTEHQVWLAGLTPDTRYFYAVASSEGVLASGASGWAPVSAWLSAEGLTKSWSEPVDRAAAAAFYRIQANDE